MKLIDCNFFVRDIQIQPTVLEGDELRSAFDNRVFYVLDGNGKISFVDEKIDLVKDTIIYIRPGVGYCFYGKMKVVVINFDATRKACDLKKPLCPYRTKYFDDKNIVDATIIDELPKYLTKQDPFFREYLISITKDFVAKDNFSDLITSAKLKYLLTELVLRVQKNVSQETALVEKIYGYIKLNVESIKSNDEIADYFGYHPVYIGNVFKKITGKTLHQARIEEKINLACLWLTKTNRPVEDIAISTGFSSRNHFCTVFKSRIGVSPLQYKKQNQ